MRQRSSRTASFYALVAAVLAVGCSERHLLPSLDGDAGPCDACAPDGGEADANDALDARTDACDGGACDAATGSTSTCWPTRETCDGLDNDCNGLVDDVELEGGSSIACDSTALGVCSVGRVSCVNGEILCVATALPSDETCDGLDNDCDGLVDEEGSFRRIDEGLAGSFINDVRYDPRNPAVLFAVSGNRVYRSVDDGASFHAYGPEAPAGLARLAFSPHAPSDAARLTSGRGLYELRKDEAGALAWRLAALDGFALTELLVHPKQPLRLFAGSSSSGMLVSDDGGASWRVSGNGVPYAFVHSLAGDPNDADHVLAGIFLLNAQGGYSGKGQVLETLDAGASWHVVYDGSAVHEVKLCPSDPTLVYAAARKDGLLVSNDGGAHFQVAALAGQDVTRVGLAGPGCGTLYAAIYPTGIARSTDFGASWTPPLSSGITQQALGDPSQLVVDPDDASHLFVGAYGGLFASQNAADDWAITQGIANVIVSRLATSPAAGGALWMSTWGSGAWRRSSLTAPWERIDPATLPRDHLFSVGVHPKDASRVLVGSSPGLFRSSDAGATFAATPLPGGGNPLTFAYDPFDDDKLYLGTQVAGVYVSSDGGATWSASNGNLQPWATSAGTFIDVRTILPDPLAAGTLLIGTHGRGVFRSTDGAASWQAQAPELADKSVLCLVRDASAPSTLYACVGNAGVWKSDDGGASWSAQNTGLGSLDVRGLLVDAQTHALYVSTAAGIFTSDDAAVSWQARDARCVPGGGGTGPLALVSHSGERTLVTSTSAGLVALEL